jgi:uncharacterized membrane protein
MTAGVLIGYVFVPLFGVVLCVAPLATRPTIQFGVRVPPAHAADAVIRRARRDYLWSSTTVAVCATVVAVAIVVGGVQAGWWLSRVIFLVEFVLDGVCFWWVHRRVERVKSAEGWFAGRRQTVVADTSWRTEPPRLPIGWLVPAVVVIGATVITGLLDYPHLPAHLVSGGHQVATAPLRVFAVVIAQVYVTGIGSGLLALVYRSRPDLDTADPAASLRSYRTALGAFARAALVFLASVDLTLLLGSLQTWQLLRLSRGVGTLVELLPAALGLAAFLATAIRAGRLRARTAGAAEAADRDDDRFWKAGIVYVNRDDPAVLVSARFAYGWTANLGNPLSWLLIAGVLAMPVGLVILRFTVGW